MHQIEVASAEHCLLVFYAGLLKEQLPPAHALHPTLEAIECARTEEAIRASIERFESIARQPGIFDDISQECIDAINGILHLPRARISIAA